jgi:hypothetical protein
LRASFSFGATTVPRRSERWRMMSTDQRGIGFHSNRQIMLANSTITTARITTNTASDISSRRHARPRYFGLIAIASRSGSRSAAVPSNSAARLFGGRARHTCCKPSSGQLRRNSGFSLTLAAAARPAYACCPRSIGGPAGCFGLYAILQSAQSSVSRQRRDEC